MKFSYSLSLLIMLTNNILAFDETILQAPLKDSNETSLMSTICRTRDHLRWDICSNKFDDGSEDEKSFKFMNSGENKIVPMSGFGVGRSFEFNFEDKARSDLSLLVWDSPDEVESHGHLKLMMFFPRTVLPRITYESDADKDWVIVTLPNLEEVIFNGKTYEIIAGALLESPVSQDENGAGLEPKFEYNGKGVMISAHRLADYPVGINAVNAKQMASVFKQGFKVCKVPVKDLWYTDASKGGNVFFNKKYVTDQEFDKYLKRKCGFSMF